MDARVARLRWRCRRGMRELDALLLAFVETSSARLTDADIATLERVLELPDPVLHAYLLGRDEPDDAATAEIIKRIRANARAES